MTIRVLVACLFVGLALHPAAFAHLDIVTQIEKVDRRIAADPDNALLHLQRGELHRIHGDWARAEADYERSRSLDPKLVEVDYCLGKMRLEQGRPSDAVLGLNRFLAARPGDPQALALRAQARSQLGELRRATTDYTRAIEGFSAEDDPPPELYLERSRALAALGGSRLEEALLGLEEGLERLGNPVTLEREADAIRKKLGLPRGASLRRRGSASDVQPSAASSGSVGFDGRSTRDPRLSTRSGLLAALTRGPYLQRGTPNSVVVRWRTDSATNSRVRYGPAPDDLPNFVDDSASVTAHVVTLTGLQPETKYYYSVGSTTQTLAGGDADTFFVTSPPVGARLPIRIWAIGDSGTATADARRVRDAYEAFTGDQYTNVWLMLGDNAYPDGTDGQYQAAVFDTYPLRLRQTVLWPTFGNHDGHSASSSSQTGPYYDIFTLPSAAQAGGVPSGTEAYYSFDHGNVHFVCLNSYDLSRSPSGAMLTWLGDDLAATSQDWVIAFWHHPPYSKGSHNSDTEIELVQMRQNALPILEGAGVDLVLAGHSHSYERSYLLDGHYGTSDTLTPGMKLDPGDGRTDGTGAYEKPSAGMAPHEGAVYVVAGSSGKIGGGPLNHPAMYLSLNKLGSVVLDVEGDRLQVKFLDDLGVFRDYLTLVKNTAVPPAADFAATPTSGPAPLTVSFQDLSTTNAAAWSWDFENDGFGDSAEQEPTHVYASVGKYTVKLTASNVGGADVETKTDHVCVSRGTPPAVTGLVIASNKRTLTWNTQVEAGVYDVVRGDLIALHASGGDFTSSMRQCLENDSPDAQSFAIAHPMAGAGFYYVVRGVGLCGEAGTYDGGVPKQSGSRDAEIAASPSACP